MSYYTDPKNAESYIKMAEGFDGRELIKILKQFLPTGSTVLELGIGPGTDFLLLQTDYVVTGSDYAEPFIQRFQKLEPSADLLVLDAETIALDRRFDGIYSNKVLYHLTKQGLTRSFERQHAVLNPDGIALHSFWVGEGEEQNHGLDMVYYTEESLTKQIPDTFEILHLEKYTEMEKDDSLVLVVKKI